MKVVHDWLKDYIGDAIPSSEEIERLLTFHAFEVEGTEHVGEHAVIDVDVLPNRSSDCLCHRGIAREIASITGRPLVEDPLKKEVVMPALDAISVNIEDAAKCPRFGAVLIEGITIGPSPEWLQSRLKALGVRSINNVVDATNYVMYAIGQPLHAYDARKFPQIDGSWRFGVRIAKEGETIELLAEGGKDEKRTLTLAGTELLIVDESSNTPIGLAGVKGGAFAGVDTTTTSVIVEAAHFDPILTRKTARGYGIVIDASKRFENEPSRELIPYALRDAAALIVDIAGGTLNGMVDVYLEKREPQSVTVSLFRTQALLGLPVTKEEAGDILQRIGAEVTLTDDGFLCTGPLERTDLTIEEDYIEEIGRIYGYDHVQSVVPEAVPLTELNARHYYSERIRNSVMPLGFSEVITSSFRNKDQVALLNALASDKGYLRSSLRKNIEEVLDKNIAHTDVLGVDDVRVFEIGTVFEKEENGVREHMSLALGVRTKANGYTPKDDKPLLETLDALRAGLGIELHAEVDKGIVEINLTEVLQELPPPMEYEKVVRAKDTTYVPFSIYPAVSRDIALWVGEGTTVLEVEAVLNEHAGPLRVRTRLFDTFTKEGKTSYAFRLVFQSYEKTLTDAEINEVMDHVNAAVGEREWEVR